MVRPLFLRRGIGFTRVLLCIRDNKTNGLRARFGFGDDVEVLLKKPFSIPLGNSRDVFYAATNKGADICIEDIDGDKIKQYIPACYRDHIAARLRFKPEELNLLKTLRNQAVLAVRQKG
ncbi:MAG: hypothetical protein ACKVQK_10430 [Burkholderiales bacterium]